MRFLSLALALLGSSSIGMSRAFDKQPGALATMTNTPAISPTSADTPTTSTPMIPTADAKPTNDTSEDILGLGSVKTEYNVNAHIQYSIRAGSVKPRGVNLGGWLVTEHWMNPESPLWDGIDESVSSRGMYATITQSGISESEMWRRMYNHFNSFYTEADIRDIASKGFNLVRVPVGYWMTGFDNHDPSGRAEWKRYPPLMISYVDQLMNWCRAANVAVLLSIHSAKGSQNGNDHSSPSESGMAYWSSYSENVANTKDVAEFLARRYRDEPAFLGMTLLNEPREDQDIGVLMQYYYDAYGVIRFDVGSDCILAVEPYLSSQNCNTFAGFMTEPDFYNVWIEWHLYWIWGYESLSQEDLIQAVWSYTGGVLDKCNAQGNFNKIFIGEWSLASSNQFHQPDGQLVRFAEAQGYQMSRAHGWTFWSWHVQRNIGTNMWSLVSVLRTIIDGVSLASKILIDM